MQDHKQKILFENRIFFVLILYIYNKNSTIYGVIFDFATYMNSKYQRNPASRRSKPCRYTSSRNVSGCKGSKRSFAHISVTRHSVSERFSILCVYPGSIRIAVGALPETR